MSKIRQYLIPQCTLVGTVYHMPSCGIIHGSSDTSLVPLKLHQLLTRSSPYSMNHFKEIEDVLWNIQHTEMHLDCMNIKFTVFCYKKCISSGSTLLFICTNFPSFIFYGISRDLAAWQKEIDNNLVRSKDLEHELQGR